MRPSLVECNPWWRAGPSQSRVAGIRVARVRGASRCLHEAATCPPTAPAFPVDHSREVPAIAALERRGFTAKLIADGAVGALVDRVSAEAFRPRVSNAGH